MPNFHYRLSTRPVTYTPPLLNVKTPVELSVLGASTDHGGGQSADCLLSFPSPQQEPPTPVTWHLFICVLNPES